MPSINPNYSFRISGFLSESGEVSEHALPPLILLHENVRSSFVRRELFPQIFGPSMRNRGDSGSVQVGAYSNILGVHGFMLQRTGFYHVEETRLVNNAAIWVDNYPIVREDPSDRLGIILDHGFAKFAFHFKNFLFRVAILLSTHGRCRRS